MTTDKNITRKCYKCRLYQPPGAFAPTYRGDGTDRRNVCVECERKRVREAARRRRARA